MNISNSKVYISLHTNQKKIYTGIHLLIQASSLYNGKIILNNGN